MSQNRALVLEPHNDDLVIGVGGTMIQLIRSGWEISSIVLTDGRYGSIELDPEQTKQERAKEKEREADSLGIDYTQLDYVDQDLPELYKTEAQKSGVLDELSIILDEFRPSVIFVPAANEGHPDHRATNSFARDLVDQYSDHLTVVEYVVWEIPFLSEVSMTGNEVLAVNIEDQFKEKRETIRLHESQLAVYDYDEMVFNFNRYLAHLYAQESNGEFVELLNIKDKSSDFSTFLNCIDAREVTGKFHR